MTVRQIQIIKESWEKASRIDAVLLGNLFYSQAFTLDPELRSLFRIPVPEQSRKLVGKLNFIVNKLGEIEIVLEDLAILARQHNQYGIKKEHYVPVGKALIWTMERALSGHWNEELRLAWEDCYFTLATAMIQASSEATPD